MIDKYGRRRCDSCGRYVKEVFEPDFYYQDTGAVFDETFCDHCQATVSDESTVEKEAK